MIKKKHTIQYSIQFFLKKIIHKIIHFFEKLVIAQSYMEVVELEVVELVVMMVVVEDDEMAWGA